MARITVPAVGYVGPLDDVGMGTISPVVVSPAVRVAVNSPRLEVPFVDSVDDEAPFTVRCVLPLARPLTVRLLVLETVVVAVRIWAVSPRRRP